MPEQLLGTGYVKQAPGAGGPILRSDTTKSPSVENIVNTVRYTLSTSSEEQTVELGSVELETAKSVFSRLEQTSPLRISYNSSLKELRVVVMPTTVHDAHQPWVNNWLNRMVVQSLLTFGDLENLERYVGTSMYYIIFDIHVGDIHLFFKAFSQLGDGYNTSRKEPDMCIRPLYEDRGLWLKGGAGSVQLIMVIKWTKNATKRVKGDIEVFNVDGTGNANLIANEVIFPAPNSPAAAQGQTITINRSHLWGPQAASAAIAAQDLTIMIENLREIAMRNMRAEGYTPA